MGTLTRIGLSKMTHGNFGKYLLIYLGIHFKLTEWKAYNNFKSEIILPQFTIVVGDEWKRSIIRQF